MELENTQEVATQPTTVEARTFAPTSADADYANRLKQMDSLTASNSIASPDVSNILQGFNVSNAAHDAPNGPSESGDNGHKELVPAPGNGPGGGGAKGGGGGGDQNTGGVETSPSSGPDVIHTSDGAVHPNPSQSETAEQPISIGNDKPRTARSVMDPLHPAMANGRPVPGMEQNAPTTSDIAQTKTAGNASRQPGENRPASPEGDNRSSTPPIEQTPNRSNGTQPRPGIQGRDQQTPARARDNAPAQPGSSPARGRDTSPNETSSASASNGSAERDHSAANVQQALDKLLDIIKRQRPRE